MLEADVTEVIAACEQELVAVKVGRTEHRVGFQHEPVMRGELLWPSLEGFRAVPKHIQAHWNLRAGIQVLRSLMMVVTTA